MHAAPLRDRHAGARGEAVRARAGADEAARAAVLAPVGPQQHAVAVGRDLEHPRALQRRSGPAHERGDRRVGARRAAERIEEHRAVGPGDDRHPCDRLVGVQLDRRDARAREQRQVGGAVAAEADPAVLAQQRLAGALRPVLPRRTRLDGERGELGRPDVMAEDPRGPGRLALAGLAVVEAGDADPALAQRVGHREADDPGADDRDVAAGGGHDPTVRQGLDQRVPSSMSESSRRMILPDDVIGSCAVNWMARGTL